MDGKTETSPTLNRSCVSHKIVARKDKYDSKFRGVVRDAIVAAAAVVRILNISSGITTVGFLAATGLVTFAASRIINKGIKKHIIKNKTNANGRITEGILTAAQIVLIISLGLSCDFHAIGAVGVGVLSFAYGKSREGLNKLKCKFSKKGSNSQNYDERFDENGLSIPVDDLGHGQR